jgi:hypothetical protein
MGYKRLVIAAELPRGESLTRAMAGIGMLFAVEPASEVNIEDTLLAASVEGMECDDLRVLAVLVTWIKFHHTWINADRLTRAVSNMQAKRVPAGVLRDRDSDVMPPAELSRIHRAYRYRILMGPTYRADMWSALEYDSSLSVSELAKRTYGSFATAWQIKHDFSILAA